MHIPEHIIEEVRSRADIVDVVGEHVRLQKRGKNYLGLCPFHSEKTPSFNVNPELGIYKCFGCGKSGSAINFVKDINAMSFPEAVRFLARKVGVVIEDDRSSQQERESQTRSDYAHRALAAAADFFEKQLGETTGAVARHYFTSRGFDDETCRNFHCGYAPDDWQTTSVELMRQGFAQNVLEDAGLIIRRDDGGFYDRFRGRVMFPIHDTMGRVVGFGGRVLRDENGGAKYVNSPQSLVYDKSSVVYGLFQAKNFIRQQNLCLLTEGYADTMSLHQFGFRNAVASSGTALTAEQLRLIGRYSKNICIAYDGDDAGINASMKAVELCLDQGFEITVITLPDKDDPDSFLRKHGADSFSRHLRQAKSFIEFFYAQYSARHQLETPKGRAEALRTLVTLVARVDDALHREFLLRSLAPLFSMRDELLYAELARVTGSGLRTSASMNTGDKVSTRGIRSRSDSGVTSVSGTSQRDDGNAKGSSSESQAHRNRAVVQITAEEKSLLSCALQSQDILRIMETEFGITTDVFFNDTARNIFSALMHGLHAGLDRLHVLDAESLLNEDERNLVSSIVFENKQPSESWEKFNVTVQQTDVRGVVSDALLRMELQRVLAEIQTVMTMIRDDESDAILHRFTELSRRRQDLEAAIRQIAPQSENNDL